MKQVLIAVEGVTDEPVAERLVKLVGMDPRLVYTAHGKSKLDPKISGYNASAERVRWLVLRDADTDTVTPQCPTDLIERLAKVPLHKGMCFRVAVPMVESWLLADRRGISQYFKVPIARVPERPDELQDAKAELVNLCRRSKSADIRGGMVPTASGGRKVGPEYVALTASYARVQWDPTGAAKRSRSLDRAIACLDRIKSAFPY